MNNTEFDQLLNAQKTLEKAAEKLIDEYRELWIEVIGKEVRMDGFETVRPPTLGLYPTSIDEQEIQYHYHETWSYGGSEHHNLSLPSWYLYDDWKPKVREELTEKRKLYDARINSEKNSQRQKDLAKLEELKNKYER